jgi:hypothetical protein
MGPITDRGVACIASVWHGSLGVFVALQAELRAHGCSRLYRKREPPANPHCQPLWNLHPQKTEWPLRLGHSGGIGRTRTLSAEMNSDRVPHAGKGLTAAGPVVSSARRSSAMDDDPELASYLQIEERELEAGGLN